MNLFMQQAYREAKTGMTAGEGGPFGAVVVREGKVIASAHNIVLLTQDSTAHAEIVAIRKAERLLGTHDLSGCELYTTSYPCPMCLGAIMWARISKVYYGCTPEQVSKIGFDDKVFYEAIEDPNASGLISLEHSDSGECLKLLADWIKKEDRKLY
ncbi:Guanine deaminase [Syntrophobotulus glycolicus DSM 8271]|uniref:Guanine deaminase n=1 Tax=Syntrophobotulus glycolicus (strain DSM 8271 / FlGlyR) TaxID=645991 RepID=F0SY89_SYNGF|nr:nucleoside deaminase [Syntrophobotulus glycolicus]ADY55924.1 Guanine deaminase [Syntrophobotulus glycolicus DSM 8271]